MSAKHTPTPWEAEPKVGRGAWIKGADGNWSALSCGETDANGMANAAFIVRACNAHDELVAALKLANDAMNYMGDVLNGMGVSMPEDVEKTTPAFKAVRAAIAKAEGRS